jgi:chromosome partitioning protein
MKVLAVANQKGGVGKTTTTVNMAVCLHALGKNVLVIDLDAQGHVAVALGLEVGDDDPTILDLLRGEKEPDEVTVSWSDGPVRLDVWPAAIDLSGLDREYAGKPSGYHLLKEVLEKVGEQYDFVLIDCARALGLAAYNAFVVSDAYMVPVVPGILALDGIRQLESAAREIKRYLNPTLECAGILLTRADARTRLTKETADVLTKAYDDLFFPVIIYELVRYANAVSDGVPIEPADDEPYMELTKEVLRRVQTIG